jgi:Flp pilus assembly protein TadG
MKSVERIGPERFASGGAMEGQRMTCETKVRTINATKMRNRIRAHAHDFASDESGVFWLFSVMMFLMILMIGGIGVDLMRSERDRTVMQNTLDRAVLAAADLDQSRDAAVVVQDYFDAAGLGAYVDIDEPDLGLNYKTVSATAGMTTTAQFMRLSGVNEIDTVAYASAEERIANVEISMVLDISGSMRSHNRMTHLKTAAKSFVDTVLNEANEDLVSVSIIPYDEHVNVGPEIMSRLPVNQVHNFSHCVEFEDADFEETAFDFSTTHQQMQHTRLYNSWGYQCPTETYERMTVFSQDNTALKWQIDQLQPSGNTHIFMGMKWAATLLDPSFNVVIEDMAEAPHNIVDDVFADRPAEYNDAETLKTVVLMTDGVNTSSYRVADWAYATPSHYAHWSNWSIMGYLQNRVHHSYHHQYYYTKYWRSFGDTLLQNICDAAKDEGVVIWTIGLEVGNLAPEDDEMLKCASSPSHYFDVDGIEITDAFNAIARQINQLRLTQ